MMERRLWRRLLIASGIALALLQLFRAFHGKETTFIANDGDWYYAYCASLYFDHDLDLSNQMQAWTARMHQPCPDIPPGHPTRTAFTVGPALLWMPAFALADLATWATGGPRDGYGLLYQLAVALATLLYGLIGVWFALKAAVWWVERSGGGWAHGPGLAAITAVCATPVLYYLFFEPTMAHALSVFAASLLAWVWLRTDPSASWGRWIVLGLLAGLCALVRPQDSVLLVLPAAAAVQGRGLRAAWRLLLVTATAGAAFAPQIAVWMLTFGQPLVTPQGSDFMGWSRPHLLQVWLSPHHGLFTWTPIWLIALLSLVFRRPETRRAAAAMLVVFLLDSYVNSCARDWWGGDAFGARRFLGLFPVFTLGLSLAFARLGARRPGWAVALAAVAVLANLALMGMYVTGRLAHG